MSVECLSSAIDDFITAKLEAKPDKWSSKADWLDDAAKRAKQLTLVTHVAKYTHSDNKSSGALVAANPDDCEYLSTRALHQLEPDFTGNAASLDVANLLLLEANGIRLLDRVKAGDTLVFALFSADDAQKQSWCQGLAQALEAKEVTCHTLAKQTYFPVAQGQYHLISPLFASTLCQALHQRIEHCRFSDEAKQARDARRKNAFFAINTVDFPHLAEQHFGGTKPQNLSLGNSKRGGRAYMLSCRPPVWQNRLTPPNSEEHFWKQYEFRVRDISRELTRFLKSVLHKDNNMHIKAYRAELVDLLVAELHAFAAQLRTLPTGWTQELTVPVSDAFGYWLDPVRYDSPPTDWPEHIGQTFGRWLNKQLQPSLKHIGDIELRVWQRQLRRELRLLKQDLEDLA